MSTSNRPTPVRVLCMEDDPGLVRLLQKRLGRAGYVVDVAHDGEEGLTLFDADIHDVVLVDHQMPVHTGLEVIGILSQRGPLPPTIMITGGGNERLAVEALKLGARDYLVKDVDMGYLSLLPSVIEGVLQQVRLEEEKQQAEEALREYAAQLEAHNQELDAFAHTVAHDLKNPLQHMSGYAYILESDYLSQLDELGRESVRAIAQAVDTMASIIEELLLLSSVRQEEVTLESLHMGSVAEAAVDRLSPMIEQSQATITVPDAWPAALGYGPWIQEVWVNYVSNAIKYGGHPPRVELGATSQADHTVRFWVHDNGQGLTTEEQASLFTPFTRLRQVKAEGHGLGLSIVRRIMDKLGGGVGVESGVGEGSTFFFTLPRP